jgi:DNA-binding transcriptional ArsR family regulator
MHATRQIAALADPTRHRIFDLVREAPSSVRALTDAIGVSQPAVSQHLKVLREASLVLSTARGAANIYSVNPIGVEVLRRWADDLWDDVLDRFVDAAENAKREETA